MESMIQICSLSQSKTKGKRSAEDGKDFSMNQLNSLLEFQKLLEDYVLGNKVEVEDKQEEPLEPPKKKKKKKKKFMMDPEKMENSEKNTENVENLEELSVRVDTDTTPKQVFMLAESTFERVMEKCVEDKEFWSADAMRNIIQNHMLPRRCYKHLFHCIKVYRDFDLLEDCSQHLKNVPEILVMDFIRFLIKKYSEDTVLISKFSTSLYETECPISNKLAAYICYLLSFPFHEYPMQQQMKRLTQNEALVLLQVLSYMLYIISPALYGDTSINALDIPQELTEKQILRWLESLLDGHLVSFTLSPTLRPLVQQISKTAKRQIRFYKDIASLAPYLEHLEKAYPLPEADNVGSYKYEQIIL